MADNFVTNPGTGGATFASDDIGGIQYPRAKQVWGADGVANDVSTTMPMPIQTAATNFIFSALGANSTDTQLAAGATFTGTVEGIQSQQTVSVILRSDRAGTLTLRQFVDAAGSQDANTWVIPIAANVPFSRAYTANGNYFRLTFQNTSGSATTTLLINTAFGTLPAVTDAGFGPVDLSAVNGVPISLGQVLKSASLPVTIASDQGSITVAGPTGSGTALSGNPTRVGGAFNTTQPTVATGQVVDMQATARGEQLVALSNGALAVGVKAASTAAAATDPALVVSLSPNSPITAPAITKGTQGATGVMTQALHDSGRNIVSYFSTTATALTATEALVSLTGYKGNASVAATTTPAVVTAGKLFRIMAITATYVGTATAGSAQVSLRVNNAGLVAIGSFLLYQFQVGPSALAAGTSDTVVINFPNGLDIPAGAGIGLSLLGLSATQTALAGGYCRVGLHGFEY